MPKKHITIPVFLPNAGCPNRCVFCNQEKSSGSTSIPRKEEVEVEIEKRLATRPLSVQRTEIAFFGGNFTGLPESLQEMYLSIARRYLSAGLVDGIRLSTRPDYIDTRAASLLKNYCVDTIELGVQSFSDMVLEAANRGHDSAASLKAIDLLDQNGIGYILQIMSGLPESTVGDELRSARIAADAHPRGVRIFPTVVLEGTALADLYRNKRYEPLTLEQGIERCKKLLAYFIEKNVPVIRMGLHPLRPEETGTVLAGPYHPSFGYLVKSRLRRDEMETAMGSVHGPPIPVHITLGIPLKNREEYIGRGRENLAYIREKYHPAVIDFITSTTNKPEAAIITQ